VSSRGPPGHILLSDVEKSGGVFVSRAAEGLLHSLPSVRGVAFATHSVLVRSRQNFKQSLERCRRECGSRLRVLGWHLVAPSRAAPAVRLSPRRAPGTFELDVLPCTVRPHHLAEQDSTAVAELPNEVAELVPGIGKRERRRSLGHAVYPPGPRRPQGWSVPRDRARGFQRARHSAAPTAARPRASDRDARTGASANARRCCRRKIGQACDQSQRHHVGRPSWPWDVPQSNAGLRRPVLCPEPVTRACFGCGVGSEAIQGEPAIQYLRRAYHLAGAFADQRNQTAVFTRTRLRISNVSHRAGFCRSRVHALQELRGRQVAKARRGGLCDPPLFLALINSDQ